MLHRPPPKQSQFVDAMASSGNLGWFGGGGARNMNNDASMTGPNTNPLPMGSCQIIEIPSPSLSAHVVRDLEALAEDFNGAHKVNVANLSMDQDGPGLKECQRRWVV